MHLKVSINIYIGGRRRLDEDNDSIEKLTVNAIMNGIYSYNKEESEILRFISLDESFPLFINNLLDNQKIILKIVVTKITVEYDKNSQKDKKYIFSVNLGDNADTSQEQKVDFSNIINDKDSDYRIKVYKVTEVSSCSNEFQFNLTINDIIEGDNDEINLQFTPDFNSMTNQMGNRNPNANPNANSNANPNANQNANPNANPNANGNRTRMGIGNEAKCLLSSKNKNHISCQFERQTPNIDFKLTDYFSFDSNRLIYIASESSNFTFPLYCVEEAPIAAIIFISAIFLFVVIVVIITIIVINKKGRGEHSITFTIINWK